MIKIAEFVYEGELEPPMAEKIRDYVSGLLGKKYKIVYDTDRVVFIEGMEVNVKWDKT